MFKKFFPYLQLMRPANLVTAVADVMAGFAISGCVAAIIFFPISVHVGDPNKLIWLCIATIGLYGGGVVFNDVFDAALDKVERPERPIPSGRASLKGATLLALSLFGIAFLCAFKVSIIAGCIAIATALMAVLYDKVGKHTALGPVNMGICRGLNLALGMACGLQYWYLCLLPIAYISAITLVSKGEVHGGSKINYIYAFVLYTIVVLSIGVLIYLKAAQVIYTLPFLIFFAFKIYSTLYAAAVTNEPRKIMLAVKTGVISLIIMNATIGACFGGVAWGLFILMLLPLSIYLGKKFAVT